MQQTGVYDEDYVDILPKEAFTSNMHTLAAAVRSYISFATFSHQLFKGAYKDAYNKPLPIKFWVPTGFEDQCLEILKWFGYHDHLQMRKEDVRDIMKDLFGKLPL